MYGSMQAKTTREKIINDCLVLLWRNGVNGTSMADLAEKASILKGSFYNYFKSKEEFIGAVLESYAQKWEANVISIFREKKQNIHMQFKSYFSRMKEMASSMQYTQGSLVGNFAQELSGTSEKFAKQTEMIFRRIQFYLEDALKNAQKKGILNKNENPKILAEIILNSMEGAILRAKIQRSTRPIELFEKFFMQKLIIG